MQEALIPIVAQWVVTGQLAEANKPALKAAYLEAIGATPGCTTCDSFWSDVRQYFFYTYKQLNRTIVAKDIRKFLILGAGFLMLPGSPILIVNEGEESEDRKVQTDEMMEKILLEYPDYARLISINPTWQALQDAKAELEAEGKTGGTEEDKDEDQTHETVSADVHADLQTKYEQLLSVHDTLIAENKQLKQDNTTLKGQLTKLRNAQSAPVVAPVSDSLAATTVVPITSPATITEPVVPVVSAETVPGDTTQTLSDPNNTSIPQNAAPPSDTDTSKTGAAGTADGSSASSESSSAGNSGADSVKSTVDSAKA